MTASASLSKPAELKRIVTVCEKKDIGAWTIASDAILRMISSEDYLLICPDTQIEEFRQVTDSKWRIVGESGLCVDCNPTEILARVHGENIHRVPWLLQQFLKINAIVTSELDDHDLVLIWDADTVPMRKLEFIDPQSGKLMFYYGTENHSPYFATIEKLLGIGKVFERSFIAQNLPLRVGWARSVVAEIKARTGLPYAHAVLESLPGKSGSEFSEYETIGTWIFRHHRDEIEIRSSNRWLRCGTELLGKDPSKIRARILLKLLSFHYDYIAIENWQRDLSFSHLSSAIARRGKGFFRKQ